MNATSCAVIGWTLLLTWHKQDFLTSLHPLPVPASFASSLLWQNCILLYNLNNICRMKLIQILYLSSCCIMLQFYLILLNVIFYSFTSTKFIEKRCRSKRLCVSSCRRPDSADGFLSPSRSSSRNGEKDWENGSTTSSVTSNTEYTGNPFTAQMMSFVLKFQRRLRKCNCNHA